MTKKNKKTSVRKKRMRGVSAYDIPDTLWKCPGCDASIPDLVNEDPVDDLPDPWMSAQDYVTCYHCDWSGRVEDVAQHAKGITATDKEPTVKPGQVKCPCCHGEGVVTRERSDTFSQVPPDEADAARAFLIVTRLARFAEEDFTCHALSAIVEEIKTAQSFVKRREE